MIAGLSRHLGVISIGLLLLVATVAVIDHAVQSQESQLCEQEHKSYDDVIRACTAAIEARGAQGPRLTSALYTRGVAYFNKNDYDRAIEDLTRSIKLSADRKAGHADPSAAYGVRGNVYSAKGDDARAIADFNMATKLAPEAGLYYDYRGLHYLDRKDYDRAIADFDKAIKYWDWEPVYYNHRGTAYKAKGQWDKAITDHTKSIELNPGIAGFYAGRADAYWAKGEMDLAAVDYIRSTTLNPGELTFRRGLGYVRFVQADYALAVDDLRRSIDLDPYPMLFLFLARARSGESGAEAELLDNARRLKDKAWPFPLVEFLTGQRSPEELLGVAGNPDQTCEAHFYIGQWHLLRSAKDQAIKFLQGADQTCPRTFIERVVATAELRRLQR
jgi:tetratricopeptide (TPR) repeat protein